MRASLQLIGPFCEQNAGHSFAKKCNITRLLMKLAEMSRTDRRLQLRIGHVVVIRTTNQPFSNLSVISKLLGWLV